VDDTDGGSVRLDHHILIMRVQTRVANESATTLGGTALVSGNREAVVTVVPPAQTRFLVGPRLRYIGKRMAIDFAHKLVQKLSSRQVFSRAEDPSVGRQTKFGSCCKPGWRVNGALWVKAGNMDR
jgi:hypothetical protein